MSTHSYFRKINKTHHEERSQHILRNTGTFYRSVILKKKRAKVVIVGTVITSIGCEDKLFAKHQNDLFGTPKHSARKTVTPTFS